MVGSLLKDGLEVTNDPAAPTPSIVNTCSFIDAAQEESVDTILESAPCAIATTRGQALVVSGCLPQRFRDELPRLFPEVDAFMGIDQVRRVARYRAGGPDAACCPLVQTGAHLARRPRKGQSVSAVDRSPEDARTRPRLAKLGRGTVVRWPRSPCDNGAVAPHTSPRAAARRPRAGPTFIPDYATPRFRLTPRHFAYVKIAEGCNHPCSFCIIPRMRGSHRSRPQADIVEEARPADRRRREGAEPDLAGLDLLRPGPAPEPQPGHRRRRSGSAAAGGAARPTRPTLRPLAARVERAAGRLLDPPALHAPGALDRRTDPDHRRVPEGGALRGHARCSTSTRSCWSGCAARRRRQYIVNLIRRIARRHSGHRAAHHVHRRVSRRDRGVLRRPAGVHPRDPLRAAGRVHLLAGGRHARRRGWRARCPRR